MRKFVGIYVQSRLELLRTMGAVSAEGVAAAEQAGGGAESRVRLVGCVWCL